MKQPVLVVVTSDHHCNSTVGLMPVEGVKNDDGNVIHPNKPQAWLWERWLEFWGRVKAERVKHRAKLVQIYNGDIVEGQHHGTLQTVSGNSEVQDYVARGVLAVPLALKPDAVYVVRGTAAHVGEGAVAESALAKWMNAVREMGTDAWSHYDLWLEFHGVLLNVQHHCSIGGLPWTKPGAVARLAFRHRVEQLDNDRRPADIVFRAHVHQPADSYDMHRTRAVITPPWQLKTSYAHQRSPESVSVVGGVMCLIRPDKTYEVRTLLYRPDPPTAHTL